MFNTKHQSVQVKLPLVVDESTALSWRESKHFGRCLDCRQQMAYLDNLRASTRSLQTNPIQPPVGLLSDIMRSVDAERTRQRTRTKIIRGVMAVGGAAVATVGVVAIGKNRAAIGLLAQGLRP